MTGRSILPAEDWDSVLALGKGAVVAQFGYGDGTDTATLAQSANMVVAMVQGVIEEGLTPDESYERWHANIREHAVTNNVLGSLAPFPGCSQVFVADSFGLAFVYPPALGRLQLLDVLLEAQRIATVVAVVADRVPYRIAEIMRAGDAFGWTRTVSGQLHVMRRTAAGRAVYPAVM